MILGFLPNFVSSAASLALTSLSSATHFAA